MGDISKPESPTNVRKLEAIRMQVKDTMSSKFAILPEDVDLPTTLKGIPKAEEDASDVMFRNEVSRVLPTMLEQAGNVLVIQNIATQHAVATASEFLEAGLDIYFTRGYYHAPERVISVALANEARIKQAKEKLERSKLRGIVVSIDAHAMKEDDNGKFDKFLPNEEQLKELGINRIVLVGEFPPQNAQAITERLINKKEDWNKSHMYGYLRQMKSKGYPVSLIGIDLRHR